MKTNPNFKAKSILQSWQNNEQSSSNSGSNIKKNGIIGNE